MSSCVPARATPLPTTPPQPKTTLRWSFRRGDDLVVCQLGLDREDSAYELTMIVPWILRPSTEYFTDAIAALQRQAAVERLLVDEGWSLESFRREPRG
jgi:hypothetical protein